MLLLVSFAFAGEPLVFGDQPLPAPIPKPDIVIVQDRLPTGQQVTRQIDDAITADMKKKAEEATAPR